MVSPFSPASLTLRHDGTPYSPLFDDIYHSANGAFAQAQHVFIKGNELPARWADRSTFSILETGFGLGINFLATWAAWRSDARRCARLHFVSIEKHPFTQDDLRLFHARNADTDFAPLAAHLCNAWPVLTPGLHRLEFESQRVILTLVLGDVSKLLPQLRLSADAFYLDGFAPAKNQEMWSPALCKALARVATHGATLATYTAAGAVRRALNEAGFEIYKAKGFNLKREMLVGRFAPRWQVRHQHASLASPSNEKRALIIGAGLAGCAVAERLASRNWQVSLIERHKEAAYEASGNPVGLFHPLITRDDSLAARVSRAGFLYALQRWQGLIDAGQTLSWEAKGLLQLASQRKSSKDMQATLSRLAYPHDYASYVTRQEASLLAGITLADGGWYFPKGGWINPISLCHAQLALAGNALTKHFERSVSQLIWRANQWCALDEAGHLIAAAPVAIIANANDAARLLGKAGWQYVATRSIRGQLTIFPQHAANLNIPISGDGYLAQLDNGHLLTGASYDVDDFNQALTHASHRQNFAYLSQLAPTLAEALKPFNQSPMLSGRVSFRCATNDRLPLLGPLADETLILNHADRITNSHLADLPRASGLFSAFGYGSRGLTWAALGAELIASQLEGEPWPIERVLADAIDPSRFLLHALRCGHIT